MTANLRAPVEAAVGAAGLRKVYGEGRHGRGRPRQRGRDLPALPSCPATPHGGPRTGPPRRG
jgi:hypothetical protein